MAASVEKTMESFMKVRAELGKLGYDVSHVEVNFRNDEWSTNEKECSEPHINLTVNFTNGEK